MEGKENEWPGEAKIAGRAVATRPEGDEGEMFTADITAVVVTGLDEAATRLVIMTWTPERGLRRVERD